MSAHASGCGWKGELEGDTTAVTGWQSPCFAVSASVGIRVNVN